MRDWLCIDLICRAFWNMERSIIAMGARRLQSPNFAGIRMDSGRYHRGDDVLYPSVRAYAATDTWMLARQLIQMPGFCAALAQYCEVMTRPPAVPWPVNKVFAQKLRYIVCFVLIGNYARWRGVGGEPPTLAALQRAAPASARQIAGFVNSLRHGGYVIAERHASDRRAICLRPSSALLQEIARSPLAFLEAAERILVPEAQIAAHIGDDDDRLADWIRLSVERFQADDILFGPFATIVHFTEHDCGYPLLAAVMGAHYAPLSPDAPRALSLTYAVLAERFQVSRQHIGNLLIEAERRGWFTVAYGGRSVAVSEELVRQFETWAAGQMAHYRIIAAEVARDLR
ncbi:MULTISPECIES: MarR family transcriptional regulator [unclassified Bradyrhizobium]|uniref:MarR family transcriptional regulator n=1 Tax=unclassified Bradyrhizobium TaxID=2631580 RepID=UPI0020138BE9|nr:MULTISPECIES: MarR family transcriptional regulator [unclassified Bradyrhizobium]